MLLPSRCAACSAPGPVVCPRCAAALVRAGPVATPAGLDDCSAALVYDGVARALVLGLKYRNRRGVVRPLGRTMAALVVSRALDVDVVTWVPTTAQRRRARGYDQARLLARDVARSLGVPCRRLLRRHRGPPQTGASMVERARGPRFRAARRDGIRILVVDDVVTTGATLAAAARALRSGGALSVTAVTAAATPRRVGGLKLGGGRADNSTIDLRVEDRGMRECR